MSVRQGYICHLKAHFLEFYEKIPTTFNVGATGFRLSCQMRAWALVGVRLCIFLQVGLLKCTFPSGSLSALVTADSKIRLGLLYGLLRVGLLSRGTE